MPCRTPTVSTPNAVTTASQNSAGAHLPQEAKRREVDQSDRSDDDDGAQSDGGQRRQQRGEKEQEDDGERGGDQPDPLRFAAHLIVDGRARGAERSRKPGQETGADIGHADGNEFLVGIDLLAVSRRKDARGEDFVGVDQDGEGQGGGQQGKDILKADSRDRQTWQSSRHRADDRDALCLQVKHGREDNGNDDDDERAGQGAIHAAHDEQRRHADDANGEGEQVRFVQAADELQQPAGRIGRSRA